MQKGYSPERFFPSILSQQDKAAWLNNLADQYPFFAAPSFFLLQSDSEEKDQMRLAGLHFHPLRLHSLLHSKEEETILTHQPTNQPGSDSSIKSDDEDGDDWSEVFEKEEKIIVPEIIESTREISTENNLSEQTDLPETFSASTAIQPASEVETESILPSHELQQGVDRDEPKDLAVTADENESTIYPTLAFQNPLKVETPENPEAPLFEPLYTSDYFASQGIKITEDKMPADKLGKQLKSFTQWLQTMKSLQPAQKQALKVVNEAAVQHLAEKSNVEDDIITEAMAEAFVLQGKTDKARETYEKLKLINPSRISYFAAKINEL